jgi:integrase
MRLNDRTVTNSTPKLPAGKNEHIIFDEDVSGFGLRLRDGGSRVWIFQYKLGDKHRRLSLGKLPKLSAKRARELVDDLAAKVALGQDPAAEKYERRAHSETFEAIQTLFLAAQAKRLKPRSYSEVERHLTVQAKPLHNLPVTKVERRDVAELLTALATESGPVAANRVRSSLSSMFNWAMKAGEVEANPAAFTNKETERPRARVLGADELREIWKALPKGDFGAIVKLLILTGQRRNEFGDLHWSEVDLKRGAINLPPERVKNNRAHVVPMSEPVRALIKATPKTEGRDFIFGYGAGGFSGWSRCKERLDASINAERKTQIPNWTLHDLRRTVATGMADIGIAPHIIEAALNHASGHKTGVAGVYNRSTYDKEVRQALTLWGERVLKMVSKEARTKRRKSRGQS